MLGDDDGRSASLANSGNPMEYPKGPDLQRTRPNETKPASQQPHVSQHREPESMFGRSAPVDIIAISDSTRWTLQVGALALFQVQCVGL